ncbi:MAG: glycosyltransferase family 2 protein [bacterium]
MSEKIPFVSVVMPVRNAGSYIGDAIESIITQDYNHNRMEIIVSDGMSEDNTREIVDKYKGRGIKIKIIDNERRTVPYAMSKAVLASRGEIIVRLDGHAKFPSNYISTMVDVLLSGRADCAGGGLNTIGIGMIGKVVAIIMSSIIGVGTSFRTVVKDVFVDTVAFGAYWRSDLLNAGEYIPYLTRNSDEEHNYRLREKGKKILALSDPKAVYISRGSIKGLFKQMFGYGYYKPIVLYLHPKFIKFRQILPIFFIMLIGLLISSIIFNKLIIFFIFLVPIILYLLLLILFTFRNIKRNGISIGFLSGICTVVIHTSYGIGELIGFINLLLLIIKGESSMLKKSWYRFR